MFSQFSRFRIVQPLKYHDFCLTVNKGQYQIYVKLGFGSKRQLRMPSRVHVRERSNKVKFDRSTVGLELSKRDKSNGSG